MILSSPEDWRAVHVLRAECDAILVGAQTLRRDNPALVIRDAELRKKRVAEGRRADIMKVTVSGSGDIAPTLRFFTEGEGEKVVFTHGTVSHEVSEVATVVSRPELTATEILNQLRKMNVETLMVEGGSVVLSMFLRERNWDEFRLAVAPVIVGDERAPRLVHDGEYPPMALVGTERLGQTAVMHFANRSQHRVDCHLMERAIRNSAQAPVSPDRYRVGAVVATMDGRLFDGHTGETSPEMHAEEEAAAKALAAGADLRGATVYSTLEPCSVRKSKSESCAELIIRNGVKRVVYAMREPDLFAICKGGHMLADAGIEVDEAHEYTNDVTRVNSHIL